MISKAIKILQSDNFYGAGEFTELAKGKCQYTTSIKVLGKKIKRLWLSKKK